MAMGSDSNHDIWEDEGQETQTNFLFDTDEREKAIDRDLSISKPVLVVFDRKDLNAWHAIEEKVTVIGREGDVDLVIPDETISRSHAKIVFKNCGKGEEPVCTLEDLGSRNGTFINGRKIAGPELLENGDRVFLGKTCLVYYLRTEQEIHSDKKMRVMATRDALTGLLNRGFMIMQFQREFDRALRYKRPISVMMIDLDNFKQVNDNYGHQAGDVILEQVAQMITSQIRVHDVAGRYGGEEFAVLLPETDIDGCRLLADRVRQVVEDYTFVSPNYELSLTISIGLTVIDYTKDRHVESMINRADMALLDAKRLGKNRVVVFQASEETR